MERVRAVALLLVLATACSGTPAHPRPSPPASPSSAPASASPSPSPVATPHLASPPRSCPGAASAPHPVTTRYGKLVGGGPAWGGFYAPFRDGAFLLGRAGAPFTPNGWRIKVLWVVEPGTHDPVTLTGASLEGDRLRFHVEGTATSFAPVLDPRRSERVNGGWREFPSYVYFPEAGCYRLLAVSGPERWTARFAVGR